MSFKIFMVYADSYEKKQQIWHYSMYSYNTGMVWLSVKNQRQAHTEHIQRNPPPLAQNFK